MAKQILGELWGGWAGYVATVAAWVSGVLLVGCALGDVCASRARIKRHLRQ
jgi:hypothetical protein